MSGLCAIVATNPASTMTDSGAPADESGYATDQSLAANSTTSQGFDERLGPLKQLDSVKCHFDNALPEYSEAGKLDNTIEGPRDRDLQNVSHKFLCGSQKFLAKMISNSQSIFLAAGNCEGSTDQTVSIEEAKKNLWAGSCSPSVSTPSMPDLGGSCSFSSSMSSDFSVGSSLLSDSPLSCSRVTSTPFARGAARGPVTHQGKSIRKSSSSLHSADSPYFSNASQPNSPRTRPRQQRNSFSSLGSFTSDYFSNGSIATLATHSELQITPGGVPYSSDSISRGKGNKSSVWSHWMGSVDNEEANPVQPLNLSCQSLPSDSDQHCKNVPSAALPLEECLKSQEISTDSGLHSSYSSNHSRSLTTLELQSCSFPALQTDRLLRENVQEQSLELKPVLKGKGKNLSDCVEKCRTNKVLNVELCSELVVDLPVSEDTRLKTDLESEHVQPNPDSPLANASNSASPTPTLCRLVKSASSPNLSPQTSVNDASVEEEPSCQTSASVEEEPSCRTSASVEDLKTKLVFFSSSPFLPSSDSSCGIKECKRFSHSSFEIQDISERNHCGSILMNSNILLHKFLSTPDLSSSKQVVEHSSQGSKKCKSSGKTLTSPVYTEISVDHPSNSTNAVTKPPISIDSVTKPPILVQSVPEPPKHKDVLTEHPNESYGVVNAALNLLRAEAECKHASSASSSHKLFSTSINISEDSLILPCPDNCKTYPVSPYEVHHSSKHPLSIADAKRNLCFTDLKLDKEDYKTTPLDTSWSTLSPSSSNYCNHIKLTDKNGSALPPQSEQSKLCSPSESCSSSTVEQLPITNIQTHHLPIPSTPSPPNLSSKPPIYPTPSSLVHPKSSRPNRKFGAINKQSDPDLALPNNSMPTTESKHILTYELSSRRSSVGGSEHQHLTCGRHTSGTRKEGHEGADQTTSLGKLDSESKPKTGLTLLARRDHKLPQQPSHHFSFLPLVTASGGVRREGRSVVALLMEEAPYLLPAVLRYLGPRDLVAVTSAAKQLRAVVMETSSLRAKIRRCKKAWMLEKENISWHGKTDHPSGPVPRAALNQLNSVNSLPSGRCLSYVLGPGDHPPPRGRPQQVPQPALTGRKEGKRSPRKILGVIQSAVYSLHAAVSPSKAAVRSQAARVDRPLKVSKKLFASSTASHKGSNHSSKDSTKSPVLPPCHCSQCQAACHSDLSPAVTACDSVQCWRQLTGPGGRSSRDCPHQALEKADGGAARRSRRGANSGSLLSGRSTNSAVVAKDDSPTKFSPIKLNMFAKSTIKRLRRL